MNAEYFKRMDPQRFQGMASDYLKVFPYDNAKLAAMVQPRITFVSEIPEMLDFLIKLPDYDIALYENKKQKTDSEVSLKALPPVKELLAGLPSGQWNNDELYKALQELAASLGMKNSQVLWPARIALSGKAATPCGATELLELLGKDESLARLDHGIKKLL
jgi:glutamyl-tRNA synthetase